MRILVTGGLGFIGSQIVDRYIELGHSVAVIDDLSTGRKIFLNPKATFYQVDIRDKQAISQIFEKEKPEVLNHHAAQMDVRKSVADPIFDAEVNILGLLNLLENGRKNNLKQVIFASSGGTVYGDCETVPTPETESTQPVSPYGISKLSSEHYLHFYTRTYQINRAILRYGNVYGPRQNPHGEAGVIAIFCQKMLRGEQPIINGDGTQQRDFVFVGDIVEANSKALDSKESFTVNIGTGVGTDVNKIYKELVKLTGTNLKDIHGPQKPGEQKVSILDAHKAHSTLGWQPLTTLEQGLAQTVEFFQNEI